MQFVLALIIISLTLIQFPASALVPAVLRSLNPVPVLHFTLARRGGNFAANEWLQDHVNMTYLVDELERTEARYNLTRRVIKGNKLVRKAKIDGVGGQDKTALMGKLADDGLWYAKMAIGQPPQTIEMDLNMLASDFYVVITTSRKGSRYDDLFSQTGAKSYEQPFPSCTSPSDIFHLPTINESIPLSFTYCRPSKFSLATLGPSGSTLGLASSESLRQTKSTSLLRQLFKKSVIQRPIFSLTLINGQEGILSAGGTSAKAIELVEQQTKAELDRAGGGGEREEIAANAELPSGLGKREIRETDPADGTDTWEKDWRWVKVQGAEGWWQILMQGVWVDGIKILRNQATVIDINSPFILAPPLAAKAFYASISGSRRLPHPHSNFYIFPCLNPPKLHLEFGGWLFPLLQGGRGVEWTGIPGGKFSLGRLRAGSGYCVGAVVETRMGADGEKWGGVAGGEAGWMGKGKGTLAGNGMRDVWVIGEGFFRGVGAVFDFQKQKVGLRIY